MRVQLAFTDPILGSHEISPERNGSVGIGVLKKKLRAHIPALSKDLQERVEEATALEMKSPKSSHISTLPSYLLWIQTFVPTI